MKPELIAAIVTITLALVFYTIGVLSERNAGTLTIKHVVLFYLGLVCDSTGTAIMSHIANSNPVGLHSQTLGLHALTGGLAIVLMLFHAVWATWVLVRKNEQAKQSFHKLSGIVWAFWLVPYICGVFIGGPSNIPAPIAIASSVIIAGILYFVVIRPKKAH